MITPSNFKFLLWNANGIRNKKIELFDFLIKNSIHVCCLTETKLNSTIKLTHPEFRIYRLDNEDSETSHGGVAIVVRKSVQHKLLPHLNMSIIEAIGISLHVSGNVLTVVSAYYTGTTSRQNNSSYENDLRTLLGINNVCILGDFNSRHPYWNCATTNPPGNTLYHLLNEGGFEIYYPNSPTYYPGVDRQPSTLDLMLTNSTVTVDSIISVNDLSSDHLPVQIELDSHATTNDSSTFLSFSKANWPLFRRYINEAIDLNAYQFDSNVSTLEIDQRIDDLTNMLQDAIRAAVPTVRTNYDYFSAPPEVQDLIRMRNSKRRL